MVSDSPVLDGGARFPEVLTIRLPEGFLSRMKAAAEPTRASAAIVDRTRIALPLRSARACSHSGSARGHSSDCLASNMRLMGLTAG